MRHFDDEEAPRLNAERWQVELLALNPSYLGWGPHEDYMCKSGDGWESPVLCASWRDFGPWTLDDLNECVNFYFSVNRDQTECATCKGSGYHPDAQTVVDGFSDGEKWCDKITQDEVYALLEKGRLKAFTEGKPEGYVPSAAEVNTAQHAPRVLFGTHDSINRWILISARLKRLGIPETCTTCEGHGYTYTAPAAHVTLTLWMLHPRKGCSRGVEVSRIEQADLPSVYSFLRTAAQRNASRFAKVPD